MINNTIAYIETWGCQLNYHRSEEIAGSLAEQGYQITDDLTQADLIVFNTCAVREKSEQKVVGRLGQIKDIRKPDSVLGVGGCMAQHLGEDLNDIASGVDFVFGTSNLTEILDLAQAARKGERAVSTPRPGGFEKLPTKRKSNYFAWVTIAEGCSNACSYCIVPQVRGPLRSRKPGPIIEEVNELVNRDYKEIQLLGQNVNAYGKDFDNEINFAWLLDQVARSGVERISFTTPHPADLDQATLEAVMKHTNICRHIHLPLQSGSDRVLEIMNRNYSSEDYLRLIDQARTMDSDVNITTDIIVGHPGETKDEFQKTLNIIERIQFGSIYVAKYSPRPHTLSATMDDYVPKEEKSRRLQLILKKQKQYLQDFNERFIDRYSRVLVEGTAREDGMVYGKNEFKKTVTFPSTVHTEGDFATVKLTENKKGTLTGRLEERVPDDSNSHVKPRL